MLNVIDENAPTSNRLLLGHSSASSRLFLRPGKYHVTAMDRQGHTLTARDVEIAPEAP